MKVYSFFFHLSNFFFIKNVLVSVPRIMKFNYCSQSSVGKKNSQKKWMNLLCAKIFEFPSAFVIRCREKKFWSSTDRYAHKSLSDTVLIFWKTELIRYFLFIREWTPALRRLYIDPIFLACTQIVDFFSDWLKSWWTRSFELLRTKEISEKLNRMNNQTW